MSREISLGYKPRELQLQMHKERKRWNVLVCHRRFGKTHFSLIELIKSALTTKNSRYAYVAPTYKQAKKIAWDILRQYTQSLPLIKYNQSELTVTFHNGSKIELYGSENVDGLRGIALWGVVFDEYSQQPANIFTEVIRPALADNKGWAIWIGTPKGKNAFYDLYKYGQSQDEWYTRLVKASESGYIEEQELEDSRRIMGKDEYNQEYECSFEAAIKGAYYSQELNQAYSEGRLVKSLYDKVLPVYTFWDLGISDYMSIVFAQFYGNEVRIIDYYENNGEGFTHYRDVLADKGYHYAEHWFPHDIEVKELSTGVSRLETVRKMFDYDKCRVGKKLSVMDGIGATRMLFYKFWFDEEKTELLRNAIAQYTQEWDDKRGVFRDTPKHDWTSHAADAVRYLSVAYNEITYNNNRNNESFEIDYGFE